MDYEQFIEGKKCVPIISGHEVEADKLNPNLFDFQRVITKWAVRRGRAAIFADTGLGKTLMQTSWADEVVSHTQGDVLILAPLCVAHQTVKEGLKFGTTINYCRTSDGLKRGINITNYEMMDEFDLSAFAGIVADESSIIKNRDGKTRNAIIDGCKSIPYRLSCTATPSPNDYMELGNQAEFLGVMGMSEMLATYFTHDGGDTQKWILKGHGKTRFWEWLATWAVCIRSPADLGFDGSRYILPKLNVIAHVVESKCKDGLFADIATGLLERNQARRDSIDERVSKCAEIVNDENWSTITSLNGGYHVAREEKAVHERIPAKEFREVETNTGTAEESQYSKEGTICGSRAYSDRCKGESEGVAVGEPVQEKGAEDQEVWNGFRGPLPDDGNARSQVRDLRIFGHYEQEDVSSCGSLPQNGVGARAAVLELQPGNRNVQRRYSTDDEGNRLPVEKWVIWCHINDEQDAIAKILGDDCVSISGSDSMESKIEKEDAWRNGNVRVLLSKPKIFGHGMNWQHCHNTAFVGLSDSWEQYYQAIRRFYRFGQQQEVNVHVISAESEGAVVENIRRKEEQNKIMGEQMVAHMREAMQREILGTVQEKSDYVRDVAKTDDYEIHLADCIDLSSEIESDSIDYTIFSPPFASLYTYSNSDRDMGNCKNHSEFYTHFRFLVNQMFRITRPGRLLSFHCMNLPTSKVNDGVIGLKDFRGELIRMFQDEGWIYHSEVVIWKDPVTAMQRTKALGLLHKTIRKDSAMSRQGIPDYLVTMRKPGDNLKPISHTHESFPVQKWQEYASPVWMDINPTRTLQFRDARDDDDERHICPLQLDVVERAIDLWSAPGDLVFSPFVGIGTEMFTAVSMGRKAIGSELKPSYWQLAIKNMAHATSKTNDLFAAA